MKHLIDLRDLEKKEVEMILKRTASLKKHTEHSLEGKHIAMMFSKPSTRTRLSFEVAARQLGAGVTYFGPNDSQLSRGETVEDTIRTVERYADCAVLRVFEHRNLVKMAKVSKIPVINALSDLLHPCQALADLQTMKENFGKLKDLSIAFFGDGSSNVCHSLINAAEKADMNMTVSCPKEYEPLIGGLYKIQKDPLKAAADADVIYTDSWVSMGQDKQAKKKEELLKKYQVNSRLLRMAGKDAIVMHCLPAHRGHEITDEVIDGKQSVVFNQAENRLHVQKAILCMLMDG